jgi:ribonuclease E
VALYILNEKRAYLAGLDETHDLHVSILVDDKLSAADIEIERTESREGPVRERPTPVAEPEEAWTPPEDEEDDEIEAEEDAADRATESRDSEGGGRDRKRRRRRGGRGGDESFERPAREASTEAESEGEDGDEGESEASERDMPRLAGEDEASHRRRRRRRGRRGGRRLREEGVARVDDVYAWHSPQDEAVEAPVNDPYGWRSPPVDGQDAATSSDAGEDFAQLSESEPGGERKRSRGRRRGRGGRGRDDRGPMTSEPSDALETSTPYGWSDPSTDIETFAAATPQADVEPEVAAPETEPEAPAKKPRRGRAKKADVIEIEAPAAEAAAIAEPVPEAEAEPAADVTVEPEAAAAPAATAPAEPDPAEITAPPAAPRRGWWRRLG